MKDVKIASRKQYLLGYYQNDKRFKIVDSSYRKDTIKLKKKLNERIYKRKFTIIPVSK